MGAQSVPKKDSTTKVEAAKAQESTDQSLFLDYVKSIKDQNQKDIDAQNKRIDEYLKSEENKIDFHVGFLEIFLAVMFGLTVFFAYSFRKEAKTQMAELKSDIIEKKTEFQERYDTLKNRLIEAENILINLEKTAEKVRTHEQESQRTLELIKAIDPEKALSEIHKNLLTDSVAKSIGDLKNSGLEALKSLYYAKAVTAASEDEHEDVIRLITNYLDIVDGDESVYYRRGRSYAILQKREQALDDFNKAISLNPNYPPAYIGKGNILSDNEKFEEALLEYDKALALESSSITLCNVGILFFNQNKNEKALEYFNKAIEVDPTYMDSFYNRGIFYTRIKEYDKARDDFNTAITLEPTHSDAFYNRAFVFAEMGNSDDALSDYSRAIELNPSSASAYWNRHIIYEQMGELEKAKKDKEYACKYDPTNEQFKI